MMWQEVHIESDSEETARRAARIADVPSSSDDDCTCTRPAHVHPRHDASSRGIPPPPALQPPELASAGSAWTARGTLSHGAPLHGAPLHGAPLHSAPLHSAPLHTSPSEGTDLGSDLRSHEGGMEARAPRALQVGDRAWYKHHQLGWIEVRIDQVDHEGAYDEEGVTYVVSATELPSRIIETVRQRLMACRPTGCGPKSADRAAHPPPTPPARLPTLQKHARTPPGVTSPPAASPPGLIGTSTPQDSLTDGVRDSAPVPRRVYGLDVCGGQPTPVTTSSAMSWPEAVAGVGRARTARIISSLGQRGEEPVSGSTHQGGDQPKDGGRRRRGSESQCGSNGRSGRKAAAAARSPSMGEARQGSGSGVPSHLASLCKKKRRVVCSDNDGTASSDGGGNGATGIPGTGAIGQVGHGGDSANGRTYRHGDNEALAQASQAAANDISLMRAECTHCGIPQRLDRLDAHEIACPRRKGVGAAPSASHPIPHVPLDHPNGQRMPMGQSEDDEFARADAAAGIGSAASASRGCLADGNSERAASVESRAGRTARRQREHGPFVDPRKVTPEGVEHEQQTGGDDGSVVMDKWEDCGRPDEDDALDEVENHDCQGFLGADDVEDDEFVWSQCVHQDVSDAMDTDASLPSDDDGDLALESADDDDDSEGEEQEDGDVTELESNDAGERDGSRESPTDAQSLVSTAHPASCTKIAASACKRSRVESSSRATLPPGAVPIEVDDIEDSDDGQEHWSERLRRQADEVRPWLILFSCRARTSRVVLRAMPSRAISSQSLLPASLPQARRASIHQGQSSTNGASPMFVPAPSPHPDEKRFPHFRSLASLRAARTPLHIDYWGQLEDGPPTSASSTHQYVRPPPAARQRAAQPGGMRGMARRKGGGKARAKKSSSAPTQRWMTRNGQKIYYDANGRGLQGSAAYRASQKERV